MISPLSSQDLRVYLPPEFVDGEERGSAYRLIRDPAGDKKAPASLSQDPLENVADSQGSRPAPHLQGQVEAHPPQV